MKDHQHFDWKEPLILNTRIQWQRIRSLVRQLESPTSIKQHEYCTIWEGFLNFSNFLSN